MTNREYLYDDRAPYFRMLADGATTMAEHHGVAIDDTTYSRWRDVGGLLRELDTLKDDYGVSAMEILDRLRSYDEFTDLYPHLRANETGPKINAELLHITETIFRLGALAASTTSAEDYAALRLEESIATAGVITKTATADVMSQPSYHDKFVPEFETFTVGLTFIDSFLDGRRDYREGSLMVEPNLEYYRALRRVGRSAILDTVRIMVRPPMMKQAFSMGNKRIRNRLSHGLTEYSTMQNLPRPLKRLLR